MESVTHKPFRIKPKKFLALSVFSNELKDFASRESQDPGGDVPILVAIVVPNHADLLYTDHVPSLLRLRNLVMKW